MAGGVSTSLRGIAVGDAEARLSEEPGAGKLHAGICAGGGGVTPFPTATLEGLFRPWQMAAELGGGPGDWR